MTNKDLEEKLNSMQEKLGEEASNLILDDIAFLINDNKQMNTKLDEKDEKIKTLEKRNENLQIVNGNLLQQVSQEPEPLSQTQTDFKPAIVDLRTAFDEKRKFYKIILTFFVNYDKIM